MIDPSPRQEPCIWEKSPAAEAAGVGAIEATDRKTAATRAAGFAANARASHGNDMIFIPICLQPAAA
jgi:hypothetical protein